MSARDDTARLAREVASLRDVLARVVGYHHCKAEAYTRAASLPCITVSQKRQREIALRCASMHTSSLDTIRQLIAGAGP